MIGKRFGYHCFCALRCFFPRKKSASRPCKFYRGLFAGDLPSAARRRLTRGGALANQVLQVYGLGAAGRCRLAFQSLTGDRSGSDRPHSDGQGRLRSAHGSGVLAKNEKKDGGKETPPEFLSTRPGYETRVQQLRDFLREALRGVSYLGHGSIQKIIDDYRSGRSWSAITTNNGSLIGDLMSWVNEVIRTTHKIGGQVRQFSPYGRLRPQTSGEWA